MNAVGSGLSSIAPRLTMIAALRCLLFISALAAGGLARADSAEPTKIAAILHGMFDKPEARLNVAPVVVSGDHAIADWAQGEMGGRALLRKRQQAWVVILCAGDGIKTRDALTKAGVPAADAARLEQDLAAAEARLATKDVAMFSRFEGLVMMDEPAKAHR